MLWGAGCVNCACPVLTGGWRGDPPPYRTQYLVAPSDSAIRVFAVSASAAVVGGSSCRRDFACSCHVRTEDVAISSLCISEQRIVVERQWVRRRVVAQAYAPTVIQVPVNNRGVSPFPQHVFHPTN